MDLFSHDRSFQQPRWRTETFAVRRQIRRVPGREPARNPRATAVSQIPGRGRHLDHSGIPEPPSQDSTYHGYGFQNLLRVDPRFGSEHDLQALVDEAHASGIYVILDIVINHTGDVFEYEGIGSQAPFRDTP